MTSVTSGSGRVAVVLDSHSLWLLSGTAIVHALNYTAAALRGLLEFQSACALVIVLRLEYRVNHGPLTFQAVQLLQVHTCQ